MYALVFSGADEVNVLDVFFEKLVQIEDGLQRDVLGAGGDMLLIREMGEELRDFICTHLCRMLFVVKEDVACDPVDIGLFGSV